MKHGKKFNHLSRQHGHRKALMKNMSTALITHKRINTTLAKAKALRKHLEPLVTKAKKDSMHSRRVIFSYLQDKAATAELFETIGPKVMDRPGGYLRIIKTGFRLGDSAETAMIEFVDFNDTYSPGQAGGKKKRTRRSRRKSGGSNAAKAAATTKASQEEE